MPGGVASPAPPRDADLREADEPERNRPPVPVIPWVPYRVALVHDVLGLPSVGRLKVFSTSYNISIAT
jgi:hypothetical protein